NKPLGPDVELHVIAKTTAGFTGADLENLVNEAALLAARQDRKAIIMEDIQEATIKVVAGPEKRSHVVPVKDKTLTSYHEAGHAVCTYYCKSQPAVHQISIIPRGQAGGYTLSLPDHDENYRTKKQMHEDIIVLLGGRIAEQLVLDDISTGASNDLQRASATARNMVTKYGFSEKLGPIVYGTDQNEVFLGRDLGQGKNYSENVASIIDEEVRIIIDDAYQGAKEILSAHMDKLEKVAKYLFEYEKIERDDFAKLMTGDDSVYDQHNEVTFTDTEPQIAANNDETITPPSEN
ncbi:MAG: ATP-dependent zinc metalloprotease FtsH, partial [Oscillospiraceae bacterium]